MGQTGRTAKRSPEGQASAGAHPVAGDAIPPGPAQQPVGTGIVPAAAVQVADSSGSGAPIGGHPLAGTPTLWQAPLLAIWARPAQDRGRNRQRVRSAIQWARQPSPPRGSTRLIRETVSVSPRRQPDRHEASGPPNRMIRLGPLPPGRPLAMSNRAHPSRRPKRSPGLRCSRPHPRGSSISPATGASPTAPSAPDQPVAAADQTAPRWIRSHPL